MRLRGDLVPALLGAATGDLAEVRLDVDPRAAVGIVLAAEGYPGSVTTGDAVEGAEDATEEGVQIFQAGVRSDADGRLVAAGGRVLTVCALGNGLAEARERAYAAISRVRLRGGHFRRDIGLGA